MSFNDVDAEFYNLFRDRNYRQAAAALVDDFTAAKTVLEVGAGLGDLTVELEDFGLDVTAIEPSAQMRGRFKSTTAMVHPGTLEDHYPEQSYDLGVIDYNVLKYMTPREAKKTLDKLRACCYETAIPRVMAVKPKLFEKEVRHGITRRRIYICFGKRAWVWCLYTQPGRPCRGSFHRLYLHDTKDFHDDHE